MLGVFMMTSLVVILVEQWAWDPPHITLTVCGGLLAALLFGVVAGEE